jgi:hypothetical protein
MAAPQPGHVRSDLPAGVSKIVSPDSVYRLPQFWHSTKGVPFFTGKRGMKKKEM